MPEWLPDFIVILCLVIIFAIPISYMIYNKVKKGHCGSCGCGCGAARSNSGLRKAFKKDIASKKAKQKAAKQAEKLEANKCCCCQDKVETKENENVSTNTSENTENK